MTETNNNINAGDYYYRSYQVKPYNEAEDETAADAALEKLMEFVEKEDFKSLSGCDEFKKYGVNHRFGFECVTLLEIAYRANAPVMVEWLKTQGADERVYNQVRKLPMDHCQLETYSDSVSTRVVNVIAQRYFSKFKENERDPHQLFEIINDFIKEHQWKYSDWDDACHRPKARDGSALCTLGESHLIYHVNCSDLSNLFISVARKVGILAEKITYRDYHSISRENLKERGVIGKLEMFDGSPTQFENNRFKFNKH